MPEPVAVPEPVALPVPATPYATATAQAAAEVLASAPAPASAEVPAPAAVSTPTTVPAPAIVSRGGAATFRAPTSYTTLPPPQRPAARMAVNPEPAMTRAGWQSPPEPLPRPTAPAHAPLAGGGQREGARDGAPHPGHAPAATAPASAAPVPAPAPAEPRYRPPLPSLHELAEAERRAHAPANAAPPPVREPSLLDNPSTPSPTREEPDQADARRLKERMVRASQARRRRRPDLTAEAVDPALPAWYEPGLDLTADDPEPVGTRRTAEGR